MDTSILLAHIVADDVSTLPNEALDRHLKERLDESFAQNLDHPAWYHQKSQSTYHLYITDPKGVVIYDSRGVSVGADFSRWNDVYLTLRGKYGARSTDVDGHSIMYVASPIMKDGEMKGVLSVGKPTQTLIPYINRSSDEIIKIILTIMAATLITATLMAWWLRYSIDSVNRYTKGLASSVPPHFYLGRELNELMMSIHTMKEVIENKAYVSEYVHTLTHELKSPLTAIRASSEILSDELSADERRQFTQIILSQTDKMTQLVDKLLTLAKLEQPTFKLKNTDIPLDEMIGRCLNQQSALIKQANKSIHFHESGLIIKGDAFWLGQAMQNVIDNALYYGNHFIDIHTHQSDTQTIITISNDSDKLGDFVTRRAFERYFSMGSSTHQKSTGLGLTLVKQVVELHGGVVSFDQTEDDRGNVIKVVMRLPR